MLLAVGALSLLGLAAPQQVGDVHGEEQPSLQLKGCSLAQGCVLEEAAVTLDAQWRWLHDSHQHSCFEGVGWDRLHCTDPKSCAKACALEGNSAHDYESVYGVRTVVGGVELQYKTGSSVGSRLYLVSGGEYKLFRLKNREFSFDVDVSKLGCGLNGALYFVEMPADGGQGRGDNAAGARYGTGYCDAQCPHDLKFVDGEANVLDWHLARAGAVGRYGSCCAELDIWEANREATAFTAHPCELEGQLRCAGRECGDTPDFCDCCHEDGGECPCCMRYEGVCDKDGCDFNAHRLGMPDFYGAGPGFTVDTTRPFTVVTQFLTDNGTDEGELTEIRRLYVQDGKVINNSVAVLAEGRDSITEAFCNAQKAVFENPNDFKRKGGLRRMGQALDRGMVLVLSLWDDSLSHMRWLDSTVGNVSKSRAGAERGPCAETSGDPHDTRRDHGNATVTYANISYGEIGSTYSVTALRIASPAPAALPILVGVLSASALLLAGGGFVALWSSGPAKAGVLTVNEASEEGCSPLVTDSKDTLPALPSWLPWPEQRPPPAWWQWTPWARCGAPKCHELPGLTQCSPIVCSAK